MGAAIGLEMMRETVDLTIKPGEEAAFIAAFEPIVSVFKAAPHCHVVELDRVIECPGTLRLSNLWDRVEDRTEIFVKA